MRKLNQTAGTDNEVIWIVRIDMDGDYFYFQTSRTPDDALSLSGISFSGQVILYDSISDISKTMDISQGGTLGSVGNFEFSLSRYTSYTNGTAVYDDFFNSFYPATGKPLLTSKTIDFGVVWTGATLSSEITWLEQYYIEDYKYDVSQIRLTCIDLDELESKKLPRREIQNEYDNDISYFPDAPSENLGVPIPLVYGSFDTLDLVHSDFFLAPCLRTDKVSHEYIASSHLLNSVYANSEVFRLIEKVGTVQTLSSSGGSDTNTNAGYNIIVNDRERVTGSFIMQPNSATDAEGDATWDLAYGGTDEENAFDGSDLTYSALAVNREVSFIFDYGLSTADIGQLGPALTDIKFVVNWDATVGQVDIRVVGYAEQSPPPQNNVGYFDNPGPKDDSRSGTGNTTTYNFGTYDNGDKYWSIEELQAVQFHIQNKNSSAGEMRIKNCYLEFSNILIYGRIGIKARGITNTYEALSNRYFPQYFPSAYDSYINANDKAFASCTGREYGGWIG